MNLKKVLSRKYILASKSERRIKLLKQIGLNFTAIDSGADEIQFEDHNPVHLIRHNSELKSVSVSHKYKKEIIISADTIVVLKNRIINKPSGLKQAAEFLGMLSGNKHSVYTGIYLLDCITGKHIFDYEKTGVFFRKIPPDEINFYVNKYKPLDKAGAYGIQDDFGCLFIESIKGDYYNVVGLPLARLYKNLLKIV